MSCLLIQPETPHRRRKIAHTHTLSSLGWVPLTTNQICEEGSCLDTANKVLSQVDKNWCWTTQNQTSGQKVLDQERFWIPKVTWDYNWDWKVFQLGKLLALDITNMQRCQTHYRGSISLLHLINELHRVRITDLDSSLHSFQVHSRLIYLSEWQHRLLLSLTPRSWSWENHQDTVNHLGGWVSAKVSSITGPHLCGSQLRSTSHCTRLLTSLSSLSGRLSLSAWKRVFGDDLIIFSDSWYRLQSDEPQRLRWPWTDFVGVAWQLTPHRKQLKQIVDSLISW